jgi:hypothetical protein
VLDGWPRDGRIAPRLAPLRAVTAASSTAARGKRLLRSLGVNTTANTPNLLSVKSNAALIAAITTADGGSGDVRLQISKETPANTASVFFSDNYSGRAEFGLAGDDHFRLKVSPDGASWQDAFVIDKATGKLAFHGFSDTATTRSNLGPVKQASLGDTTADRLMTTGAFGLGGTPINLTSGDSAIAARPADFIFATAHRIRRWPTMDGSTLSTSTRITACSNTSRS